MNTQDSLTRVELGTVLMLLQCGAQNLAEVAECMYVHPNTLKYRLTCVRKKWGLDSNCTLAMMMAEALRRGYVTPNTELVIHEFVADLVASLPSGPMTPISTGLREWIQHSAVRFLDERVPARQAAWN